MINELEATLICLRALMDDELRARQMDDIPYSLSTRKDNFGGNVWRFVIGTRSREIPNEVFRLIVSGDMTRSDRITPPVSVEFLAEYRETNFFDDASVKGMVMFVLLTLDSFINRGGNKRAIAQWIDAKTPKRTINR